MSASLPAPRPEAVVRGLRAGDLADVVRIDERHTGRAKPDYWERVLAEYVGRAEGEPRVGLAAEEDGRVVAYLLGTVRAFEFGSEPCGWVFAVGVEPGRLHGGLASRLLAEACRRFRAAGVDRVRTMVRRNDVPVLSFFRASGFAGGSFVQLELELGDES